MTTPMCPFCGSYDTIYLYDNVYVCNECTTEMDDKEEEGVARLTSTYFMYNVKDGEYER